VSLLLRPGYFPTLMFASALVGAASVPFAAPDLFGLPLLASGTMLAAGTLCAIGLILRWPTMRAVAFTYLGVLLVVSIASAFIQQQPAAFSWTVLGIVWAILLVVFLRSHMIRRYLTGS